MVLSKGRGCGVGKVVRGRYDNEGKGMGTVAGNAAAANGGRTDYMEINF